jgi:molybdate transport system regulatory protein
MDMSYRRAWLLIDDLNRLFRHPVVATRLGGAAGGGAELTALGKRLVRHYRDMESEAHSALKPHLSAFQTALAKKPSPPAGGRAAELRAAGSRKAALKS